MRPSLMTLMLSIILTSLFSQVGISPTPSTPDPSSMLDISATNRGLLMPRMTISQRNAITLPAHSLMIYQTDSSPGFYYNKGTPSMPEWVMMPGIADGDIHLEDRIPIDSLPYTISTPGSYYVTHHLTGPTGITITTSHVTLDLNGYTLAGAAGNTSEGIKVPNIILNLTIRNGGVAQWGKEGIKATLATFSTFSHLNIVSNAYDGLNSGNHCIASFITAGNNGFDGIDLGENSILHQCTASQNLIDGLEADTGSALQHCTSRGNTQAGIRTTGSGVITACVSSDNDGHGFSCGTGSVVTSNAAYGNALCGFYLFSSCMAAHNVSRSNIQHGFQWLSDCELVSNTASLNGYSGFSTTYTGGNIDQNTSTSNVQHGYTIQIAGGCRITRNTASGNGLSAFNILAGNAFATVITSANINTNTNPFANFQL